MRYFWHFVILNPFQKLHLQLLFEAADACCGLFWDKAVSCDSWSKDKLKIALLNKTVGKSPKCSDFFLQNWPDCKTGLEFLQLLVKVLTASSGKVLYSFKSDLKFWVDLWDIVRYLQYIPTHTCIQKYTRTWEHVQQGYGNKLPFFGKLNS